MEHDLEPVHHLSSGAPLAPPELVDALALIKESEAGLSSVEAALKALGEGTYGRCEVCGARIDGPLLVADAARRRCRAHEDVDGVEAG